MKKTKSSPFWDFWAPLFFALTLYLGVRQYIVEARYIPSGSMLPGLQIKDRLLIEKLTFRRRKPLRGEIVVFNSPYSFDPLLRPAQKPSLMHCALVSLPIVSLVPGLGHPACDAYIKRVVAIAGDNVLVNRKGQLVIEGKRVKEPYVTDFCSMSDYGKGVCKSIRVKVPKGHVLVLGDNRRNSWDSRFWPGGPFLPEKEIIGRAIWRFWPINRLGPLGS